jgi:DNA-binding SARP family transcriptional activator
LAFVAASQEAHASRDKLIGNLWPEQHDAQKARHRLSVALNALRSHLGEDCLITSGDSVALNRDVVGADVCDFQDALGRGRLEEAVGHYGGAFLDGFFLKENTVFEQWVDKERRRLQGLVRAALTRLANEAGQAGNPQAAVEWWRQLAAEDRYSSSVAMGFMKALAAAGDVAAAVRHARTYATLVEGELAIAPKPDVLQLAEELAEGRRGEEGARVEPEPAAAAGGTRVEAPASPVAASQSPTMRAGSDRPGAEDLLVARRVAGWAALAVLLTLLLATVLSLWSGPRTETASQPDVDVGLLPFRSP